MPAARTFSPPITAKAATRSDTLKMIALTRLDMMMRISFVLDVAGPLLAYLHYISTFGCAPLVPGCKSATLTTDGYFFLLSVTGLYRVRLRRSRPANCSASLAPTMCKRMKLVEPDDR